jgi:predicted MFS family arabinose efflux permease
MFAMIDGLVRMVGSVLGGVLYLTIGFRALVVLNTCSYLVSVVACHRMRHRSPPRPAARVSLTDGIDELRTGLRHVLTIGPLRRLLRVTAVFYLANGAITALLVPYARSNLRVGAAGFGYLLAALGVGYVIGTLFARSVIERFSAEGAVVACVPLLGTAYLLAFQPVSYPVALAGFAAAGVPAVVLLVAVPTEYQRRTPNAMLGRVASAFLTVEMAVSVTGAALASVLAQQVGVLPVIDLALLVLGALGMTLPVRPVAWRFLTPRPEE